MIKKLLVAVPLALALVLAALPGAALAHSKVAVECTLTLFVTDPGADEVKVKDDEIEIKNSGQMTIGSLVCFDANGDLVPEVSGTVTTDHGSKVKFTPTGVVPGGLLAGALTGDFKGKLKGKLTLISFGSDGIPGTEDDQVLEGKISGKVEGEGVLAPGFLAGFGFPDAALLALSETITGKWELEGDDIEGEGEFSVVLGIDPESEIPVLDGSLSGEVEFDDEDDGKDGEEEEEDDDEEEEEDEDEDEDED